MTTPSESLIELFNKLLSVYKELQWSKVLVIRDVHYNICPLCDQLEGKGHASSCLCFKMNEKLLAYGKDIIEELCKEEK